MNDDINDQRYTIEQTSVHNRSFGQVLRSKAWLMATASLLVVTVSVAVYPNLPRTYNSSAMVLLQPTDQAGQPIIGRSAVNALDENEIQAYEDILSSRPMLETVIDKLHLVDDPEFNTALQTSRFDSWKQRLRSWLLIPPMAVDEGVEANLRKHLSITRDHKSYAMQVGFWSSEPTKSAAMANALADAFVTNRLTNKLVFQQHFAAELERRQAGLAANVAGSELRVHMFKVQSGLIHQSQHDALEHQLTTFSDQYAQATSTAASAEDHAKNLLDMQRLGTLDSAPEVLASSVIRNLKERLITLTSGTGTGQTTGGISATPEKLNELKQLISVEAQRIVRSVQVEAQLARSHAEILRLQISAIDKEIITWKESERQLESLEREADVDRVALKDTMTQLRQQGSIMAALRSDADIISTAVVSSRPAFPNLMFYAVGTLFMAILVAGVAVADPYKGNISASIIKAPRIRKHVTPDVFDKLIPSRTRSRRWSVRRNAMASMRPNGLQYSPGQCPLCGRANRRSSRETISMQSTETVSVLMTTYHGERADRLACSLESMFSQTRAADEFVLVIDGEVGAAQEAVVSQYAQDRRIPSFKVVRLPKNVGLGSALAAGTECCTGAWIMRMDSDDVSVPNRTEVQLAYLRQHPETDLIGGWAEEFNENAPTARVRIKTAPVDEGDLLRKLRWRNVIVHPSVMLRSSVVRQVGGFQGRFLYLEDWDLFVRIALSKARLIVLPQVLLRMSAGQAQASRRGGWRYAMSNLRFHTFCWRSGFMPFHQYIAIAPAYLGFRLVGSTMRQHLYRFVRVPKIP